MKNMQLVCKCSELIYFISSYFRLNKGEKLDVEHLKEVSTSRALFIFNVLCTQDVSKSTVAASYAPDMLGVDLTFVARQAWH